MTEVKQGRVVDTWPGQKPPTMAEKLLEVAKQLEEDAVDCWGVRRKLNLRNAANVCRQASVEMDNLIKNERIKSARTSGTHRPSDYFNDMARRYSQRQRGTSKEELMRQYREAMRQGAW